MVFSLTEQSEGRARAIGYLIDAYEGVEDRTGQGLPHAQAVADILRDAGYDERVQVVALLHDVVEDTPRTIDDVRDGFGDPIAAMVAALTEDDSIRNYAQRKRALRAQGDRRWPAGRRRRARGQDRQPGARAYVTATRVRRRMLTHYEATLQSPSPPAHATPSTRPRCNSPSPPASTTRYPGASQNSSDTRP